MLQVSLLGSFAITVDGRRIHSDLGPSGQRMAAFLFAFPGRLHRRERIADLFWRDMTIDRSRAALNSALWRLRKILSQDPCSNGGKSLRSIGDDVVLDPEPWIYVDARAICELATRVTGCDADADQVKASDIKKVLDLYDGPFLDGEEEIVFLAEREMVHTSFVMLARYALDIYIAQEEYPDAIAVCRKVLLYDPYRESVVCDLLRLLCLNQQWAEAIRFFERWQKNLREDVEIRPMEETVQVLQQVRQCESHQDLEVIRSTLASGDGRPKL